MAKDMEGRKVVMVEMPSALVARIDAVASRELLNRSSWLRRLADAATKANGTHLTGISQLAAHAMHFPMAPLVQVSSKSLRPSGTGKPRLRPSASGSHRSTVMPFSFLTTK